MDLHPTRDHDEISESAADYLARELPPERQIKGTDTALSPAQWSGLAGMGWFMMGLAEDEGGLGLSAVEEALVLREFGRNLVPPSALATVLAAHLATALGQGEVAAALAAGERRAAIAVPAQEGAQNGPAPGEYRLVDTDGADLAIGWSARGAFLAPLDAFTGLRTVPSLDATIAVSVADGIDAARADWRAEDGSGFYNRAQILTAAILTGGAEAVRDISAEYAKTRQQFGKPIGSFQAIAHPLAEMAVRCEAALSCLFYAAVCLRDDLPERDIYSASARSVASHAAYMNAEASMQVHGGYGQTYEYLPHFYLKRAMIYGLVGGGTQADEAALLMDRPLLG